MTTRVLVTSDTHVVLGASLPDALLELADRADHVIHAGDLVRIDVVDTLAALAPVTAVAGNVDDAGVAGRLLARAEVNVGGAQFAVVHDPGPEAGRHRRLRSWFPDARVIVYGHTHEPELTQIDDGPLIVNPGSPTQRRRAPSHTACWIEVEAGQVVAADLVQLD